MASNKAERKLLMFPET